MKTKLSLNNVFDFLKTHGSGVETPKLGVSTRLLFLFLALSHVPCALSQVPQGFNYQAVARDGSGNPIVSQSLPARITIQADSLGTMVIWQELHSTVTSNSFGMINLVVGRGTRQSASTVATFSDIDWRVTPKFIKTEIDHGGWKTMGVSRLWSVPYAQVAGDLAGSVKKLAVEGETSGLEEALFEVKNKDGQTVFAVYNEGVRVYVSDGAKALKGGFAVGGFGTDKAGSTKYLFVGKDSVRVYLDTNPLTKKLKGGFAVGGYDLTKGTVQNYLDVSEDSVRIYIDSNPAEKKLKGGFAVGGYDMTKGIVGDYFNVSGKSDAEVIYGEPRVLWYPAKEAFRSGNVLIESKDSVGLNSWASGYRSKAIGNYSQALGYQAIARKDYSTAIGYQAVANKINSFAFGQWANAKNEESYAFGRGAIAEGFRSYAFGSAGVDHLGAMTGVAYAKGDYSFAIGQGSQALGKGSFTLGIADTALGNYSVAMGYKTKASNFYSTAMGYYTQASGQASTAMGGGTRASGYLSTAMGVSTRASCDYSTAMGFYTTASGAFSTAMGLYTKANTYAMMAAGRYNDTTKYHGDSFSWWYVDDPLFVIGNGTSNTIRTNAVTVLKSGRVGLQTVLTPTYALELPNSSTIGVGQAMAYNWATYSDGRAKSDQTYLSYGLEEIMQLIPSEYFHHGTTNDENGIKIQDEGRHDIGLIAQDVYNIIPEAVNKPGNEKKELWSISYDKLVPVLINAVKEQQQQIDTQNQRIDQLSKIIDDMQGEIASLRSQ